MSKILARSPYWINATATDLIYATLELWVYTGTQVNSRDTDNPNFIINATVTDVPNKVYWDISDLVKDFIDVQRYDTYLDVVWVDYRITTINESGATTGSIQTGDYAVYGYSYYADSYCRACCISFYSNKSYTE